ncbi:MAG: hypothetical protein LUD07_13395 [Clostridiales bacterium]|nr:hypothetical protein [Clostridiales bacterium]
MKKWKQALTMTTAAAMLTAAFAGSAFAAESRTAITSLTITIDSGIAVGDSDSDDVTATVSSSNCDVTDVEILNDDGEWSAGDTPRIRITIEADDDYYFASMSSSKISLKGDDADYVSSSRSDSNSTLKVTVKLDELEGTYELDEVDWVNEYSPVATWEDEENSGHYQVRVYRNDSSVGSAVTTTNTYYDFASSITRTGDYTFKVRVYISSSKKGEWIESDALYVDDDLLAQIQSGNYSSASSSSSSTSTTTSNPSSGPVAVTTGWRQDSVGWWYVLSDGSYPTNGWLQIDGYWYCFDSVGYMRTGWILSANGSYYYCDTSSGKMLTSTYTPDGYYVDANGVWVP